MAENFDVLRLMSASPLWWAGLSTPAGAPALGPEGLETFPRLRLELSTLLLLEAEADGRSPTLIVAPYAIHDAAIADFAPGHSLARVLLEGGAAPLALVSWKSASPDMRDFGVDAYLGDLNVAVDDLGGRVSLVGLCQGGWLAALYAARFPAKVARLALAGAPLDLKAGESDITRALALSPPAFVAAAVAMLGGRVFAGALLLGADPQYDAASALQCEPDAALRDKFQQWRGRAQTLSGRYFLEATEWLFRENRLAGDCFPALGRACGLGDVIAPVRALAARDDRVVAPLQATAALARLRARAEIAEGGHLSLFMGRRTLGERWPSIARWLGEGAGRLPSARAKR
jgi:poly(3-hydroxyalkanoate) synthetase